VRGGVWFIACCIGGCVRIFVMMSVWFEVG